MSELIKTFSFDLQRFAPGSATIGSSTAEGVIAEPLPAKANLTANEEGFYYWKTADDKIAVTGGTVTATFSDAATVDYTVSNVDYSCYSVQLVNVTQLSNLASVTKITLGSKGDIDLSGGGADDYIVLDSKNVSNIVLATADASLTVDGSLLKEFKINGSAFGINTGGTATYVYGDSTNVLTGPMITVTSATKLTATADATAIKLANASTETTFKVGAAETPYKYTGNGVILAVNNSSVTGAILPTATAGSITVPEGVSNFKIYTTDGTEVTMPEFTPSGAYKVSSLASNGGYAIAAATGDSFTFKGGEKITFDKVTKTTDGAGVVFNADGELVCVYGLATAKDSITVTGAKDGVAIAANLAGVASATDKIAVDSGSFTYTLTDTNKASITLNQASDTVTGLGATTGTVVTQVIPFKGEGTVEFSGTVTTGKGEYSYNNASGKSYFVTASGTTVSGFYFGAKGDSLTFDSAPASPIKFAYGDYLTKNTDVVEATVTKSGYTIKLVDGTSTKGKFNIKGLEDGAEVEVGAATAPKFTFEGDGGSVGISCDTSTYKATGVTAGTDGTVKFSEEAVALLKGTSQTDTKTWFTIDGTPVFIDDTTATEATYNAKDKSLLGLTTSAKIVNSGAIEKIYTPATGSFTFGATGSTINYTFTSTGTNEDAAYFVMKDGKVDGYVFREENDKIKGNFSAGFNLYDGNTDTKFVAPKVTKVGGSAVTDLEITKTENGFALTPALNYVVAFDGGPTLTFTGAAPDNTTAKVEFNNKGALLSITGLTKANNSVTVSGSKNAIKIDEHEIDITGGDFAYTMVDAKTPSITGLTAGVKVNASGGVEQLYTASIDGGNGKFTFGSAEFEISGANSDQDGTMFVWDDTNKAVTGLSSIDKATTIVSGSFSGLTFGANTETLGITDGTYSLLGGVSLAGLKNGTEVTSAGGISTFLTAESGKFTILGGSMSIAEDADGVVFKTDGASLTGIDSLAGSAIGDFTGGLSVNSVKVAVSNDSIVAVVGDNKGVTAVNQLGVANAATEINVSASGANLFGVNENGQFVFNGAHSFAVAGNGSSVTSFDFTKEQAAITGVDKTETLSGDFSAATSVNGNVLQVAGDSAISLVGGTQILGLAGGASVMQADGISSAVTDGEGFFNFVSGGQSFNVTGGNGVTFQLDGKGKVVGISGVDDGEVITGDLNGIVINAKEPAILVTDKDGNERKDLYYENGTLSGIQDGDTVVKADNVKTVIASASGTFKFADKSQTFTTTDGDGVVFSVVESTTEVTAVASLAAGASLEGSIGGLSVNGKLVDIQKDDSFGVVGATDGIGGVYKLSDGAIVVDAAGATVASTDEVGTFKFQTSGQSFVVAGDSSIDFALADNAVTAINGLSAGSVLGSFSGIQVNGNDINVVDANNEVEVYADDKGALSKIDKVTADATIGEVGSVSQVITDKAGKFEFTVGGQSFITGDGADVVTFGLSSSAVTSISNLKGSAIGGFSGIQVNGAEIDITDGDNQLKVFGDGTKLTAIQDVDADATINKAGGVAELVGNIAASSGTFTFANSGEFKVEGDS